METEHREHIIQEIEYWRKNQLLPAHYCQFLLNLYQSEPVDHEKPTSSWFQTRKKQFFLVIVFFILFLFLFLNFNLFPSYLQLFFGLVVTCSLYAFAYFLREMRVIFLVLSAIVQVGIGIMALPISAQIYYFGICAIMWIIFDFRLKTKILSLMGASLLSLLYVRCTFDFSWGYLQIFWVPWSMLFFFLMNLTVKFRFMLGYLSVVFFFGPEVVYFITAENYFYEAQLLLLGKLLLFFTIIYIGYERRKRL